jgi:hypothetical protein
MRNRRRNWMLKRIALAFAVAAVAAPMAQAEPLEPGATKSDQNEYIPWVTDFGRSGVVRAEIRAVDPGVVHMPRVTPTDYAIYRGDGIELARLQDRVKDANLRSLDGVENVRAIPDNNLRGLDRVENIRTEPRGTQQPVLTSSPSSFDWGDAGIGAALAFAAMLLAAASALSVRQYGRLGQV